MLPHMPKRVSAEAADLTKRQLARNRSNPRKDQDPAARVEPNPYFGHPVQVSPSQCE